MSCGLWIGHQIVVVNAWTGVDFIDDTADLGKGFRDISGWRISKEALARQNADRTKIITFTVAELNKAFQQTRDWEQMGEEMFRDHALLSVYYEDMVSEPEETFKKVTDFFDVPYLQPKTALKRQNPESLRELVGNYEELKAAYTGTEWEAFFN